MPTAHDDGNGVRISNKEIYELVLEIKDIVLEEREKARGMAFQIKLQWGVLLSLVATIVGIATRVSIH